MDSLSANGSAGSGVDAIEYSLNGGTTWQSYAGMITFPHGANGLQTIEYRATDLAGNTSGIQQAQIKIDSVAPSGIANVSPAQIWPPNNKPVNVTVSGHAADWQSGIWKVVVEVADSYQEWTVAPVILLSDGRSAWDWQTTISLMASRKGNDKAGRVYTIRITTYDQAGNAAVTNLQVTVPHDQGK